MNVMNMQQPVDVYDSQSSKYHEAFQVFLDHTNQRLRAQQWLNHLVYSLPQRHVFLDIGAGNGIVTAWFANSFEQTIAIEPNESLRAELKENCPQIEVISEKILDVRIPASGDLILCSHVFYYIDGAEWLVNLERLASWLAPNGVLVVALQNSETDCMKMLEHFFGRKFDLTALARTFYEKNGDKYEVMIETVPALITTSDFDSAYTIGEFMLNLLPMPIPPARIELEEYVRNHFTSTGSGFLFSCDQDFLLIQQR